MPDLGSVILARTLLWAQLWNKDAVFSNCLIPNNYRFCDKFPTASVRASFAGAGWPCP
jgi:hypothetical protein